MAYGCQTPSAQRRSDQLPKIVATLVCSAGARNTLGPIVDPELKRTGGPQKKRVNGGSFHLDKIKILTYLYPHPQLG